MISFKIQKLFPTATLPLKAHATDAGIDIYSNETYTLKPGEVHAFATGIAAEFPHGYVALIWDRSSLGVAGIHRLAGVIDSGYRGEWKIVLLNTTDKPYSIELGEKIAQVILQKFEPTKIVSVKQLADSSRGKKGFGSSGK